MSNIDISDDLYDYELCVGYMYMYILDLDHLLNESKKAMLCTSEHAKKGGGVVHVDTFVIRCSMFS